MNSLRRRLAIICSLWLSSFAICQFAAANPHWIETYYAQRFFPFLNYVLVQISNLLPFSLAELIITLSPLVLIRFLWIWAKQLNRIDDSSEIPSWLLGCLWQIACIALIVQLSFLLCWGLNYYRPPLATILGWDLHPAEKGELRLLAEELIDLANSERALIFENTAGITDLPKEISAYLQRCWFDTDYCSFQEVRIAKPVLLSPIMSYTQITGFFFPFTGEANINTNVPPYTIPATIAHELAHQAGIAREDEANFVAWQQTRQLELDSEIRYSGTMLALTHTLNACAATMSPEEYTALWQLLSPGVSRDFAHARQFWDRYRGPIQTISEQVNDAYLKSNRQSDGVRSYGRMVDLLLAERRLASRID